MSRDDPDYTRALALVEEAVSRLRGPIRRERRRLRWERWCKRPYYRFEPDGKKPQLVHLAGLRVIPLWTIEGPGIAERCPVPTRRRFTIGWRWLVRHDYDEYRVPISLVADASGQAVLIAPGGRTFTADETGWQTLAALLYTEYAMPPGGRWYSAG
ncbi:hypothetical protein CU254_26840 [Amycolatopsis sp. AA4]|uniref:hypothetical protein n=1 Tax=Actinomycetes TaxID=1760 RepID=UPI0001B560BD|nr:MULTISPECIES: hypothetical protein [Actinomycetes]ATY13644.1 hypothetical protein CU254_26840 [Amycolatopsis sp. AA4]EFL09619.1 hypothetical protein SSMG_05290 [Streptomyces sp. AA4]